MKLCDFNTSKALQEIGYDGEYTYCHVGVYPKNEYQIMTLNDCEKYRHDIDVLCAAPRLDDVAYWLRDVHNLSIEIIRSYAGHNWMMQIVDFSPRPRGVFADFFDDYNDALYWGVRKAIKIIKGKYDTNRT